MLLTVITVDMEVVRARFYLMMTPWQSGDFF
jgi:hypothetical protein